MFVFNPFGLVTALLFRACLGAQLATRFPNQTDMPLRFALAEILVGRHIRKNTSDGRNCNFRCYARNLQDNRARKDATVKNTTGVQNASFQIGHQAGTDKVGLRPAVLFR